MEKNIFVRVFELKKKIHWMISKGKEKNKVIRDLSLCVVQRFPGFDIIKISNENEIRQDFSRINIDYQPVKHFKQKTNCYFTNMLHLLYRTTMTTGENKKIEHTNACGACSQFFALKKRYERHLKRCAKMPGMLYEFKNPDLVTYEDNLKI